MPWSPGSHIVFRTLAALNHFHRQSAAVPDIHTAISKDQNLHDYSGMSVSQAWTEAQQCQLKSGACMTFQAGAQH